MKSISSIPLAFFPLSRKQFAVPSAVMMTSIHWYSCDSYINKLIRFGGDYVVFYATSAVPFTRRKKMAANWRVKLKKKLQNVDIKRKRCIPAVQIHQ